MNWIEITEKILMSVGTFLTGIAAIWAILTWKKELKYKKRYESIEKLEESFIKYLNLFNKFYYISLDELRKQRDKNCTSELYLEEEKELVNSFGDFRFAWKETEYHLSENEKKSFNYKPEFLYRLLIDLRPRRDTEKTIANDGFYDIDMIKCSESEEKLTDILLKGLTEIRNFREKRIFS